MLHKDLRGSNLHISMINYGTNPIGVVTPSTIGEAYYDTVGKLLYIATALTNLDWEEIGSKAYTVEYITIINNQNSYNLASTPLVPALTNVYVDGIKLKYTDDFTLLANQITFIPATIGYKLTDTMQVEIQYI